MAIALEHDRFFAAPFAVDGELVGVGEWRVSDLSAQWLGFWRELLHHADNFRMALPGPLNHVELKFTSASGAALGTFYVGGQLAASAAYLRGGNLDAEQELMGMFVDALRQSSLVQDCKAVSEPFAAVFGLRQRPLHVVVPWANPRIVEKDEDLVRELANHLAAAFLCCEAPHHVRAVVADRPSYTT